jgi:hypothetical protein
LPDAINKKADNHSNEEQSNTPDNFFIDI